jgi:hypothetical protein
MPLTQIKEPVRVPILQHPIEGVDPLFGSGAETI